MVFVVTVASNKYVVCETNFRDARDAYDEGQYKTLAVRDKLKNALRYAERTSSRPVLNFERLV